jgi:flagellar hook-length control protein FliK
VTIAVDLGLLALGNADAAPSSAGDGAAAGTVAELADLFQSLVDDLAAAASVASTAAADASPVRPTKSRAPATAGADAGSVGSTKTAEAEDQSAALVALLGMSPLPVPIDLAVASEPCTTSKDAAIDPQAPAVAADGTEAQPSQVAESDEAVLDAPAAAPAAAEDPAGTILAATGAPSGQEQLPQATAAAIVQEAATSVTPVTTPPVSDKPEPPSAEEPSVAGRTDAAPGWVRPSAAGKALARALSALAVDAPAQKPARAVSNTASPAAVTNQQSAAPAMTESLAASLPAATAEAAPLTKATAAAQPDTYSFATAPRPAESQSAQPLPVEDANRPAVAADVANRAVQAAAPAAKAAVDIDVDANIIKARQSSLAFQVPVRSDGVQVQAAQGGQQASIGLAAPVVMADAGEAGTVTDQIVKAIKIQVRDGIGEVRLRLQPEQMGEVHIALKVDRDRVSAVLQVERPELRAQIEGQGQTLRAGLAAQGLKLEDLTVRPMLSDDTQGRDGNQRGSAKDTPQRRRRQSTAKQFELDDQ